MKKNHKRIVYKTITTNKAPTNKLYNNKTFVEGFQIGDTMTATFKIIIRG